MKDSMMPGERSQKEIHDLRPTGEDGREDVNSPSQTPQVSVLMPVHNGMQYVREAIDSILGQTYTDFEFVIVDDGSTDDTPSILAEYAGQDSRIKILTNQQNLGIVASLNKGLDACRGEYIVRMDGDDIATPDRLSKQISRLQDDPDIAVLGGAVTYIDHDGRGLGLVRQCRLQASLLSGNPLLHPAVVIRRNILDRHFLRYREEYRYAEDYFLWLEVSRVGKLDALEEIVLNYRLHDNTTRSTRLKGVLRATLKAKRDAVMRLGFRPRITDVGRFFLEAMMLLLPSALVYRVYRRIMFARTCSSDR
jgi:glycosyltransferase involved in cell wall biosynthesis